MYSLLENEPGNFPQILFVLERSRCNNPFMGRPWDGEFLFCFANTKVSNPPHPHPLQLTAGGEAFSPWSRQSAAAGRGEEGRRLCMPRPRQTLGTKVEEVPSLNLPPPCPKSAQQDTDRTSTRLPAVTSASMSLCITGHQPTRPDSQAAFYRTCSNFFF